MWFLKSESDQRIIYITPEHDKVTIGRSVDLQVCDFSIADDASISRKHAIITKRGNDLIVTDLGSKYGTFINNFEDKVGIQKNVEVPLQDKDLVRFGAINSIWKVNRVEFTTCASTLKGDNLQALKVCIGKLGGLFKTDFEDSCSYLTMPAITLTIKVVLALVQGLHIVKTEFWTLCCEAVTKKAPLPDPKKYLPDIVESTLNKELVSFLPDPRRKALFAGKQFVFFSRRQLEMYKPVLQRSSATALLLSESKITKSMLCASDVIVIQFVVNTTGQESQTQQAQINNIVDYLKSKNKRVIADPEIGLAILYKSLEKYCNPDFNFSEVMKQSETQNLKPAGAVLAQESQEPHNQQKKADVLIDESLVSNDSGVSTKRKFDDSEGAENGVSKKMATEENNAQTNNDSESFFNFIDQDPAGSSIENGNTDKRLNFAKPVKRKADYDVEMDEDNLFNFVSEEKSNTSAEQSTKKIFDVNSIKVEPETDGPLIKKPKIEVYDTKEFSAFNAFKSLSIKQLLENTSFKWKCSDEIIDVDAIKQEDTSELNDKMNGLDLGTTIVVKKDLIVERKKIEVEVPNNQVKNVKKFKKVWPIKLQVNLVQKATAISC